MSRIPDRRAALTHGFHLTCRGTASAVGLQWPITMLQPRDGRAKAAGCVSIQVTLAGPRPLPSAGPGMARLASLGADRVHEKDIIHAQARLQAHVRGARPDRPGAQRATVT